MSTLNLPLLSGELAFDFVFQRAMSLGELCCAFLIFVVTGSALLCLVGEANFYPGDATPLGAEDLRPSALFETGGGESTFLTGGDDA